MCGLAGGFVSAKAGQMMAGDGSSNVPRPVQKPVPKAIEPLEPSMVVDPVVNTASVNQESAIKQKELNQQKARPVGLTDTGLQIRGYKNESKQR